MTRLWHKTLLIYVFTFLISLQLFAENCFSHDKAFVVVIPSHNNKDWCRKNLRSVLNQKYENYRVFYIADSPDDGTAKLAEQYIKKMGQEARVTLITNKNRNGYLACITQAINLCDKDEVVLVLDGNDWLANNRVLSYLNQVYSNPDVWMTYGQFQYYPSFKEGFASPLPSEVIEDNGIRHFGGAITHLITFYAGLFHEIKKEDLLYDGKFIQKAEMLAYSIPIAEMAGKHSRFVSEVLYIYNASSPLNERKWATPLEAEMVSHLLSKEKYCPMMTLPWRSCSPISESEKTYANITDLCNPSIEDYLLIQDYLCTGDRENFERLQDIEYRVRGIQVVGELASQVPTSGVVPVNCKMEDKENCIMIYASFNANFEAGLWRLVEKIKESDFKGHVLYQVGGWPGLEEGSLALAHVPYAFKASFFRNVMNKGYKRALWLDASILPLSNLNQIFETMAESGHLVIANSHNVGPYFNSHAAAFFGLSHDQTYEIPSCAAFVFGLDFSHPLSRDILNRWYRAAWDKDAFFSARADQNVLSVILYQLGVSDFISLDLIPHHRGEIRDDSLFLIDRYFVNN